MKILMVGAGVIGATYGWALAAAGLDITHLVRPGKQDQFKDGVALDLIDDRRGHPKKLVAQYALKSIETDVRDNILHLLWTSHSGGVGIGAGLAKSRGVTPFLHDPASMTESYYVVKALFELCRLRGVDPYRYPDQAFLFRLPVWLFRV